MKNINNIKFRFLKFCFNMFDFLEHLKQELELYVAKLNKVRLIRSSERLGLIRA